MGSVSRRTQEIRKEGARPEGEPPPIFTGSSDTANRAFHAMKGPHHTTEGPIIPL